MMDKIPVAYSREELRSRAADAALARGPTMFENIARAIYVETVLMGYEEGNEDHLRAVFGDESDDAHRPYGYNARKAAIAALGVLRGPVEAMFQTGNVE